MQSVLQYRRFRRALELQLERDRGFARQTLDRDDKHRHQDYRASNTSDETKQDEEKDIEQANFAAEGTTIEPRNRQDHQHRMTELGSKQERPIEAAEDAQFVQEEEDDTDHDDDYELAANRTLSKTSTQRSTGTALGNVLTGIEVRRRNTREGGTGNVFVVGFEGPNDPQNPHNWPMWKRIRCTALVASIGCVVGLASVITSSALPQAAEEFHVAEVVESMATGLFLVGFGLGALFAGPISETVGSNPVYITTLAIYMIWIMASALAPNITAQVIFRFLAGLFGSTPLNCAGGSISDLYSPLERVYAFPIFANEAFTGPLLGPIVGGYIAQSPSSPGAGWNG